MTGYEALIKFEATDVGRSTQEIATFPPAWSEGPNSRSKWKLRLGTQCMTAWAIAYVCADPPDPQEAVAAGGGQQRGVVRRWHDRKDRVGVPIHQRHACDLQRNESNPPTASPRRAKLSRLSCLCKQTWLVSQSTRPSLDTMFILRRHARIDSDDKRSLRLHDCHSKQENNAPQLARRQKRLSSDGILR
eukprot:scaffold115802_cov20-Prasinocladus_malaysianus.AAC.1